MAAGLNYYNEFDPAAAQWLRNLIAAGLIPAGDVDERSIEDVRPRELAGYAQCHFFAGIGGWAYALAIAGWPSDRPVWTGSCPCQPFSAAGKGDGVADQRHLWPAWFHLIAQCRPPVVFGEQVASAIGHGWLDLVSADLEGQGYAIGSIVLGAHSVGAPHVRQRLWFVADTHSQRRDRQHSRLQRVQPGRVATHCAETSGRGETDGGVADAMRKRSAGLGESASAGESRQGRSNWPADLRAITERPYSPGIGHPQPLLRRGIDGIPARVVRLRAYGNAIVPQVAAELIRAYMDRD
jgi:DNA (cytosine-5)-methyltransferase 1